MSCQDLQRHVLTDRARMEMRRRGISESDVAAVLVSPDQSEEVSPGRCVYQSRVTFENSSTVYLLRVFVDTKGDPPEVVTAYRTSKIEKYWR